MLRLSITVCLSLLFFSPAVAHDQKDANSPRFQVRVKQLEAKVAQEGAESITRVGGTYYGDQALAVAEQFPNVERVQCLCHGYVTDKGLSYLRGKQKLRTVTLAGAFTDQGIEVLATLPKLEQVTLRSGKLTDDTARTLATIKTLKYIRISGKSQISVEAISELKRALPDCRVRSSGISGE